MGEAESHPKVAFPLGPEIQINHGKEQVLLLAERIKGGDRAYAPVVFQTPTDFGGQVVAQFRIGGKLKAAFDAFPL